MITIPVTDVDNIESADTGGSAPQRATAVVIPRGTVDVCTIFQRNCSRPAKHWRG